LILQQPVTSKRPEQTAQAYLSDEVPSVEEALAGARDIVAETISDHADVRRLTRQKAVQWGTCHSQKIATGQDPRLVYETYYDFEYRVDRLRPHQVLALNRGEADKVLRVKVEVQERDWQLPVHSVFKPDQQSPFGNNCCLLLRIPLNGCCCRRLSGTSAGSSPRRLKPRLLMSSPRILGRCCHNPPYRDIPSWDRSGFSHG